MRSSKSFIGAVNLAFLPLSASAGSLIAALFSGQVQQFTEGGRVSGCGITLAGVESDAPNRPLIFNGSAVIYRNGGALVKGRASDVDIQLLGSPKFKQSDLRVFPTKNVWMKVANEAATTPIKGAKISASEDKGYIIYPTDFSAVLPIIQAVLESQKVQVGMTFVGRSSEQVMFGTVQISEPEREQLANCLSDMASGK